MPTDSRSSEHPAVCTLTAVHTVAQAVCRPVCRVDILSEWKSLTAALLDDAAVEGRSDASTSNLLLLLKDAAHKAVGGQLVPSRQEARYSSFHRNASASQQA